MTRHKWGVYRDLREDGWPRVRAFRVAFGLIRGWKKMNIHDLT